MARLLARQNPEEAVYLLEVFEDLYRRARRKFPAIPKALRVRVSNEGRTSARSFAFFRFEPRSLEAMEIVLSPELALDPGRAEGVIAHELGHLVHHVYGRDELEELGALARSNERLADYLGSAILGRKIYYDAETVQTTDPDAAVYSVRPRHLG